MAIGAYLRLTADFSRHTSPWTTVGGVPARGRLTGRPLTTVAERDGDRSRG